MVHPSAVYFYYVKAYFALCVFLSQINLCSFYNFFSLRTVYRSRAAAKCIARTHFYFGEYKRCAFFANYIYFTKAASVIAF